MTIGFQEVAIFVGLVLALGFFLWIRSKVNKNNPAQKQQ